MLKAAIRQEFIDKRKALSDDLYFELGQRISDQFFFHFHSKLLEIKMIHIFLPIEKNKEPNTNFILKILFQRFRKLKVIVPKTDFLTKELSHYQIDEGDILQENKYGILEPNIGSPINESELDLIIIPLLAYDQKGNRIGYGGGFYDRFLGKTRPDCLKIGLSFFDPTEYIKPESTDIKLDFCVCPHKIWAFSSEK
jgi:5-formyltetrahydrofolate cyclo-ligase